MSEVSTNVVWVKIQLALTMLGGYLGYFVGGMDGLLTALVIFMACDYITGVVNAIIDHNLSSQVGFKGIFKKCLIIMLVGIANMIDTQVIGSGNTLRTAVVCFYISNEGVSLLENASRAGLPIPEKLKEILAQLHKKGDSDNGTGGDK